MIDPETLVREIIAAMREMVAKTLGDQHDNREAVQAAISSWVHAAAGPWTKTLSYEFRWTDVPERLTVAPCNLFTALILAHVPAEEAQRYASLEEGSMTWRGCVIAFRNGQTTVTPPKPAEFITIDFKLLQDETT